MLLGFILTVTDPAYKMLTAGHLPTSLLHTVGSPVVERASLGIPDTLFIFVVALVVFGPKRLPEIGKQLGKLMFEFRRASNDFKMQIEEELRLSDQQDKQKQLETQAATAAKALPVATEPTPATPIASLESAPEKGAATSPVAEVPVSEKPVTEQTVMIHPPSSGELVGARAPNHAAMEAAPLNDTPVNHAGIDQDGSTAKPEGAITDHESMPGSSDGSNHG